MSELPQDCYNLTVKFKVVVDSLEVADFNGVSGLGGQIDVQEYWEGGLNTHMHKLLGATRWSNIILRHGVSGDPKLFAWIYDCIQGKIERKSGAIIAVRQNGKEICKWNFMDAWPCRYQGPDYSTLQPSQTAIEELELAHHGIEFKRGTGRPQGS